VALANLAIIEREGLLDAARQTGAYLRDALQSALGSMPIVGEVRGAGMMLAVELVSDRETREPLPNAVELERMIMKETGVIVRNCAHNIVLSPPLTMSRDEADQVVGAIAQGSSRSTQRPPRSVVTAPSAILPSTVDLDAPYPRGLPVPYAGRVITTTAKGDTCPDLTSTFSMTRSTCTRTPTPALFPRPIDDTDLAKQALDYGMRGFVLKDHDSSTTGRAYHVNKIYTETEAIGAVVLNRTVGGINPYVVQGALHYGAKVVWIAEQPLEVACDLLRHAGLSAARADAEAAPRAGSHGVR